MIARAEPGLTANREAAALLRRTAELLAAQDEDGFRVRAYHRAAETVAQLSEPVADLLARDGLGGLIALPGIGRGIAADLSEYVHCGRLPALERLAGRADPITLLASLPGVGIILADRIHHDLGIGSLEDLELAAWDGRLEQVPGIGPRRVAMVRDSLATRLRRRWTPAEPQGKVGPPVAELLDVDREYRRKARAAKLPTIAPRRFNPRGEAWLPVLHTARGGRNYTVLFSNTAAAHRLGRTDDWVVLYYEGRGREGQATVVTERTGRLRGRRVVRGRELGCFRHYRIWRPPDLHRDTDGDGVI